VAVYPHTKSPKSNPRTSVRIYRLKIYAKHTIDFADALLVALLMSNTASKLFTFDKKLAKIISENTPKG
jgi:predicted nucleic acid-binding protein